MKKSLFAIAAVTAFAGAAQAQSSVTVYGILDVGFSSTSSRGPSNGAQASGQAANTTQKVTNSQFGQSAQTSSRIGFRGTEDLGGGTSAFFTAEFGVQPQGTTWSPNNRQTFVGLQQKGIGKASIGTQYTALWLNALNPTDPGQGNNVAGSVIRPVGSTTAQIDGAASTAVTILTTNSLYLESVRMAGFRLAANYVQNAADVTQRANGSANAAYSTSVGGSNNFNGYSISADYTWKKLLATAGYSSFKQEQNSALAFTWSSAFPGTPVTVNSTNNTNDRQWYAGAVYDFGILKGYLNYVNRKISNGLNSNQFLSRTGQQLGVRGNWTPKIESWASAGNGRIQQFGATEPTASFTSWQLGSNYILSKRTNLYAIYGTSITSGVAGSSVVGANGGGATSQYALGLRHTF
jgi:predicted porin